MTWPPRPGFGRPFARRGLPLRASSRSPSPHVARKASLSLDVLDRLLQHETKRGHTHRGLHPSRVCRPEAGHASPGALSSHRGSERCRSYPACAGAALAGRHRPGPPTRGAFLERKTEPRLDTSRAPSVSPVGARELWEHAAASPAEGPTSCTRPAKGEHRLVGQGAFHRQDRRTCGDRSLAPAPAGLGRVHGPEARDRWFREPTPLISRHTMPTLTGRQGWRGRSCSGRWPEPKKPGTTAAPAGDFYERRTSRLMFQVGGQAVLGRQL